MKWLSRLALGLGVLSLLLLAGYSQFGRQVEEARADVTATPWPPTATTGTHLMVKTFTASSTWVAPDGVTSIVVEAWGAGGGASTTADRCSGAGAYVRKLVSVTPGQDYFVNVGAGTTGLNGTDSTFATTTVVAAGGKSAANGSAGGTTADSTGDVEFAGGTGRAGTGGWGGGAGDIQAGANNNGGSRNGVGPAKAYDGSKEFPGGNACDVNDAGSNGFIKIHYSSSSMSGFPYVTSRAWTRVTALATSTNFLVPSGTQVGDTFLAIIGGNVGGVIECLGGWTRLESNSALGFSVCTKTVSGSDVLTVTSTLASGLSGVVYGLANVANIYTTSALSTIGSSINPPLLSPSGDNKFLWIAGAAKATGFSAGDCYGAPSGFSGLLIQPSRDTSVSTYIALAEKFEEAISLDPGAFSTMTNCTNTDTYTTHFTIAIAGLAADEEEGVTTAETTPQGAWGGGFSAGLIHW